MPSAYFFEHPPVAAAPTDARASLKYGLPGRYPMKVHCSTLVRRGDVFERIDGAERTVLVDALGRQKLGSNMDPMVLSDRLPWFLSFCNSTYWTGVPEGAIIAFGWSTSRLEGARYSIHFGVDIVLQKYVDHVPLERQVRIIGREGLDVESQTLWDYLDASLACCSRRASASASTCSRSTSSVRTRPGGG